MFIQSVFIRKNSPYLQEKLKEMGYKTDSISVNTGCIATSSTHSSFVVIDESRFDSINPHVTWNNGNRIDCGDNEELFLAVAALRDDTDIYQWFVMDVEEYMGINQGDWFSATDRNKGKHIGTQIDPMCCHKATVEELIKHFK